MQLEFSFDVPVGKRCSRCKRTLPIDAFYRNRRDASGFAAWCKVCHSAHQTAKYRENPAKFRARYVAWKERNIGYEMQRQRQYGREHADQRKAYNRLYMASLPPEVKKVQWAAVRYRRTLQAANGGPSPSTAELAALYELPCAYCGAKSDSIDHIHPLSRGGTNAIENLVGACRPCNSSKSNRLLLEWWREERGQYGIDHSFKVQLVFLAQLSEAMALRDAS